MDANNWIGLGALLVSAATAWLQYSDRHRQSAAVAGAARVARPTQRAAMGSAVGSTLSPGTPAGWPAPTLDARPIATVTDVRSVSLPRRFISMIIDYYVIYIPAVILSAPFDETDDAYGMVVLLSLLGGLMVYASIASATGRSLGKLAVGGRLVSFEDPTAHVSFWRATVRAVVALFTNFLLISILAGLGRTDRRTLHDQITGTRVIRTR